MNLTGFFKENSKIALGFSGGVDSSYLLYAAAQCGVDIKPYFIKTAFQPEFELEDARRFAKQVGVELTVISHEILSHEEVVKNPANRCYYCKTVLFGLLKERAVSDGYTVLIDGTNASDDVGDRPGMKSIEGNAGSFSAQRMWTDKDGNPLPLKRSRIVYLEQTCICLSRDKNSDRDRD